MKVSWQFPWRLLVARRAVLIAIVLFIARGAAAQAYYGSKWAAGSLANTQIGGSGGIQGDYRFSSIHTGALTAIHTFWQSGSGYGGGTGGTYRIDLESDDGTANHFPSGTVLATTTELNPTRTYTTEMFASPATINSGVLYHLVYTNIDANSSANFTSLNMIYLYPPVTSPAQPTVSDINWAHLYNVGTVRTPNWVWRGGNSQGAYMPTLELVYSDGFITGNGYMEVWIDTSRKTISGSNQVRETFTVSAGDKSVVSFSIRLRMDSGSDPLTVSLQTASGTVIESGNIPAGKASSTDAWVTYTFSQTRTLTNGTSYNIVLTAPGSSAYSIFPIRKGRSHNFDAPTFFGDGDAQYTSNGSTCINWPDEDGSPSSEGDLQFYFTIGTTDPRPAPPVITSIRVM
jgi:hypothetical protein